MDRFSGVDCENLEQVYLACPTHLYTLVDKLNSSLKIMMLAIGSYLPYQQGTNLCLCHTTVTHYSRSDIHPCYWWDLSQVKRQNFIYPLTDMNHKDIRMQWITPGILN